MRRVATRASCERLWSIAPARGRRRSKCPIGPMPVYAKRPTMPVLPDSDVDAIRLRENGVACGNVERAGKSMPTQDQKPGLPFRFQAPS